MHLRIQKCPDKKKFKPIIKKATIFFAEKIISPKLLENIYLRINFVEKMDCYGCAYITHFNTNGKPRKFVIDIHSGISGSDIIRTLAHEIVHIKQFAYGETNYRLNKWRGDPIDPEMIDYYSHPWEIEAYGTEIGLVSKFVIQEKLWEVFDGFCDPSAPIIPVEIGWKQ